MCLRQPSLGTREAFHVSEKNTRSGGENEREQQQNAHLDADRKKAIGRCGRQHELSIASSASVSGMTDAAIATRRGSVLTGKYNPDAR